MTPLWRGGFTARIKWKCFAQYALTVGSPAAALSLSMPSLVSSALTRRSNIRTWAWELANSCSTIVTTDGQVITGLVVSETGDKLEVLLPDTKRISLNKTEIETRKLTDISAMPPGVVKTPEELRDVIAYLLSNPTDAER